VRYRWLVSAFDGLFACRRRRLLQHQIAGIRRDRVDPQFGEVELSFLSPAHIFVTLPKRERSFDLGAGENRRTGKACGDESVLLHEAIAALEASKGCFSGQQHGPHAGIAAFQRATHEISCSHVVDIGIEQ
jgi:hypothetical protein